MPKRKFLKSYMFLIIIAVVLISAIVVLAVSLQSDPVAEALENDEVIKILFVLHDGPQIIWSDLLIYYPVTHGGAIFDIPRNTGAIYRALKSASGQNGRTDGIEMVYTELGIDAFTQEIEKLTGTDIHFTVQISLDNFSTLTDMMGGLRIFIPSPVDYRTAVGTQGDGVQYLLPSGAINLDGDKIRTYLEYQLPDESQSDIQDRKQNTVVAMFSAFNKNKNTIFTKQVFPHYSKLFEANVDSDGLFQLLQQVAEIDADRLSPQTITGSLRSVDGKQLLFPYYDGQLIKDVVKQTTSALVSTDGIIASRVYVLEIQNGTKTQGLARNTAALLQSAGYEVLSMINADSDDIENTYIVDHIGNETVAQGLAEFIRCKNIQTAAIQEDESLEADSLVDFTIVLGKDFDGRYVR